MMDKINQLSGGGKLLARAIPHRELPDGRKNETLNVSGLAGDLYFAYEKLRNAAQYTEQHLLLRAAIERFLKRNLYLHPQASTESLARELVIELTNARYLKNNTVTFKTLDEIDNYIKRYVSFYNELTKNSVTTKDANHWVFDVLSVSIQRLLKPSVSTDAFVEMAYMHYQDSIDPKHWPKIKDFDATLYFAIHRVLINSDIATTRAYWLMTNPAESTKDFIKKCQQVDDLFLSGQTNQLARLINRYGAPMRSIRHLSISNDNLAGFINDKPKFLTALRVAIEEQYDSVGTRLKRGILYSIAFLAITKMFVGLAIELPYDLHYLGYVAWVPLIINFLLPPLYMATAMFAIKRPGQKNTEAILDYAERIIFKTDHPVQYRLKPRVRSVGTRRLFNFIYAIIFLAAMTAVAWLLAALGFHIVHGVIFFIFVSATSFLRFRIIRAAQEVEIVEQNQTFFGLVSELIYMPFTKLGQWLSDKYQRLNLAAYILDILIEMPLKNVLRTLRQWVDFMRDKREEL